MFKKFSGIVNETNTDAEEGWTKGGEMSQQECLDLCNVMDSCEYWKIDNGVCWLNSDGSDKNFQNTH